MNLKKNPNLHLTFTERGGSEIMRTCRGKHQTFAEKKRASGEFSHDFLITNAGEKVLIEKYKTWFCLEADDILQLLFLDPYSVRDKDDGGQQHVHRCSFISTESSGLLLD